MAACCLISTIWSSGKIQNYGKKMQRSVVALGQWKFSVRKHNDGNMSLHICPSPQNVKHQDRTVLQTMNLGWLWCANVHALR